MAETTPWHGLPPNPDSPGWHWLQHKAGGAPAPWHWTDEAGGPGDFGWATDDDDSDPAGMAEQFRYVGVCALPDEVQRLRDTEPAAITTLRRARTLLILWRETDLAREDPEGFVSDYDEVLAEIEGVLANG